MTMDSYSIMSQVERKLQSYASQANLAHRTALINSTLLSVNPAYDDTDLHYELKIVLHSKTKAELIRLSILSWYLPDVHRCYLQEKLYNSVKHNSDLIEIEFLLKSKGHMRVWLSEKLSRIGAHAMFGNFLNKNDWSEKTILSLYSVRRIRNHKRHSDVQPEKRRIGVGYKDKGSRSKDARGSMYNFSLTQLHNQIMERRAETETLKSFLEGFLS